MKKQAFTAIIHDAEEGGFWTTCAELPEANGQGETVEEALDDLRAAIELVLEVKREQGIEPLFEPARVERVEVMMAGPP